MCYIVTEITPGKIFLELRKEMSQMAPGQGYKVDVQAQRSPFLRSWIRRAWFLRAGFIMQQSQSFSSSPWSPQKKLFLNCGILKIQIFHKG